MIDAADPADCELYRRVCAGDTTAFGELVKRHSTMLLASIASCCPRKLDPEDILQEGLLKAFQKWDRFDGKNFRGWVKTICRRTLIDHIRKEHLRNFAENAEYDIADPRTFWEPEDDELYQAIVQCLEELNSERIETFLKVKIEQQAPTEVAAEMKISVNTVYTRIHRGMEDLNVCAESKIK